MGALFGTPIELLASLISQERIESVHHRAAEQGWAGEADLARENWKACERPPFHGKRFNNWSRKRELKAFMALILQQHHHIWSRKRELKETDNKTPNFDKIKRTDLARENWKNATKSN